jgi:large subunit ribosomal protein L4
MPEIAVRTVGGAAGRGGGQTVTLRDDVFGRTPSGSLLHQAVVRHQANARQGTSDTQTRAEVNRTTKKVWRQKGTGRARQGSRKAPHWSGGGVVFGPHPRSYRQDMPKQMRRAALCAALSSKAQEGQLLLVSELSMPAPSTKTLAATLAELELAGTALLVLESPNRTVQLSARNLPYVTAITTDNINVFDVLRHDQLILTTAAARILESRYGRDGAATEAAPAAEAPQEEAAPARRTRAPKAEARGEASPAEAPAPAAEEAPKPRRASRAKAAASTEGAKE